MDYLLEKLRKLDFLETATITDKSGNSVDGKEAWNVIKETVLTLETALENTDQLNVQIEQMTWQIAEIRDQQERMEEVASTTVDTAEEIYNAREQIRIAHEKLEIQKEELRLLSITDSLTGAYNRRYLMEYLADFGEKQEENFSLLMLDIDHFKKVNDTYGHASGDAALKEFVGLCMNVMPEEAILGRLGGEEFALALPGLSLIAATEIGEKIRKSTEALICEEDGNRFSFTVSIGASCIQLSKRDSMDLLTHADKLLYDAKEGGRNTVVFAT
ncbi:MAG: GGDEF domain-containing protein [Sneathiellales bacterium]|nr:GGDEF domain-containing protein [Sneathiellales bacterium]